MWLRWTSGAPADQTGLADVSGSISGARFVVRWSPQYELRYEIADDEIIILRLCHIRELR